MRKKKNNWIVCGILLLLTCVLAVLVAGRVRAARSAAVPADGEGAPSVTAEVPEPASSSPMDSVPPDMPSDDPSALSSSGSSSHASPAPLPTPTPTPAPTPHPLRERLLCEDNLDESLFQPAKEQGRVELVQYLTCDHVSDESVEVMKDLAVYLPYGYDESKQYNVLILLHCAGADHRFWLVENRDYRTLSADATYEDFQYWTQNDGAPADGSIPVYVPNMLDRMIEEGWCEPLIVVSPCVYLYDHQASVLGNQYDYVQFTREFGRELLPFLAENYATYAADGSRESLAAAREHFGLLGASFGAYAEYLCVIGDNYDLAAWYTFCGGGVIDPGYLMQSWEAAGTQNLPLRLLYLSEGEYDDRYAPETSLQNLLYYGENVGGPFTEENVRYTMIRGWGHEDHSYLVGLFNTLQLYFRE